MRALRLRTQLVLVALAASLPLLAFAVAMGASSARQHEQNIESGLRNTATALAVAMRRELDVATGMLDTLTLSRSLDDKDFGRFYGFAQLIGQRFDGWVMAVDRDGRQLASTLVPYGTSLPPLLKPDWAIQAMETGRPAVTDMIVGTVSRRHVISLYVPVLRDGRAILALGLTVSPDRFSALLAQQKIVAGRVWVLADGGGQIVGWGNDSAAYRGTPIPQWMRRANESPDGVGRGTGADGQNVIGAVAPVPGTSWIVAVRAPAAVIDALWWRSVGAILYGGAAIVLLTVLAAVYLSRWLARPFGELADAAGAIVTAAAPAPALHPMAVKELVALRQAMAQAGAMSRDAAADRERAVVAEAESRTRAQSAERLQFLLNELDHRAKNVLAVVQSLALQTARSTEGLPSFMAEFQQRLVALAAVHELLAGGATTASLQAVIAAIVAPYGAGDRIVVDGDDFPIAAIPASAFAMALHELATNAQKYGALSVPDGHVRIAVKGDGGRVSITWSESGGPTVRPPARRGFGTRLLEATLARQLSGSVALAFEPDGVRCTIEFPVGIAA